MTGVDTILAVGCIFNGIGCAIAFVCYWYQKFKNRELQRENDRISGEYGMMLMERDTLLNKCHDLEKKVKASSDVLAVLNDLKSGGTLLHIERIDRNDVFFHQGGQYR